MPLTPGSLLGPYEVVCPLGTGGMGEVYRARDPRLGRDVAIKVLPAATASDPELLRRFEQEARAVGALSHPNILAVHDVGTVSGMPYLVTELLEGATLRELLYQGRLAPARALQLALQIARGLAAAHDKGIVHRDLKPDNVFVSHRDQAKILDFGLAKLGRPAVPGEPKEEGTVTTATLAGTIMGTVGYMSPEQVRGKAADHRSDIFSFGAVLYEMLTGRRAFQGDSAADTLTAILREPPGDVQGGTHVQLAPELDRLVQHCLEKTPERRFQSTNDLVFQLEALAVPEPATTLKPVQVAPVSATLPPRARWPWMAIAALAAAVALLTAGYALGRREVGTRAAAPSLHFGQVTAQPGLESGPALSPDARTVAFSSRAAGNWDVYVQRVGGHNAQNLTGGSPTDDRQPAFSPNGDLIAFRSERGGGGIFVMGATGESVRRVTDFGYDPAWSPDGKQLAVSTEGVTAPMLRFVVAELWTVAVATGEKKLLHRGDAVQPCWSPSGRRIAFWAATQGGQRDIFTLPASGEGSPLPVTSDAAVDWRPAWSPDGRWLYFGSDRGGTFNLWRVPIDEASGQTRGDPEPMGLPAPYVGAFSLSASGHAIAYESVDSRTVVERAALDAAGEALTGAPTPVLRGSRYLIQPTLSPDSKQLAVRSVGSREDVFVASADGSGLAQLTDDDARDRSPAWAPDGSRIMMYSNRGGRYDIWSIRPDGSGLEQVTQTHAQGLWFPVWSPDGKRLAVNDGENAFLVDLGRSGALQPLPRPEAKLSFSPTSWSADGTRLVGMVGPPEAQVFEIAALRLDTGTYERFGTQGAAPLWMRDGRRLLFRDPGGIKLLDTASRQARLLIATGDGGAILDRFAKSADDAFVFYVRELAEGDLWLAHVDAPPAAAGKPQ